MNLIKYLMGALHTFSLVHARSFPQAQAHLYEESLSQVHGQQQVLGLDRVRVSDTEGTDAKQGRPFYAIAHRVLSSDGVRAALSHGANALEIDMKAHANDLFEPPGYGWWAQHDPFSFSAGDTAETIFRTIAEQRRQGKNVLFVWLDIKTPDKCRPTTPRDRTCSIEHLRDLAREILEPEGVRVLYGFVLKDVKNRAFGVIRDGLNANEKIDLEGGPDDVMASLSQQKMGRSQSVISRGLFDMRLWLGSCTSAGGLGSLCYDLRRGSEALFSQDAWCSHVFGWTILSDQQDLVDSLLDNTNIDGLIYGRMANEYVDSQEMKRTLGSITGWMERHPGRRYLANSTTAW